MRDAFTVSAPMRLIWALAFAATTAGAVWLVESRSRMPANGPLPIMPHAAASQPTSARDVRILASYPVASWSVLADGRSITAATSDDRHWRGTLPGDARELAVEAAPTDALAGGPAALRVTVVQAGHETHHDAWGDGATGLRVALDGAGVSP